MIIKNGLVFTEEKTFEKKDIYIRNGLFVTKEAYEKMFPGEEPGRQDEVVDATDLYVLPGLVDVHSHGAVGRDFSDGDPERLAELLLYEIQNGITSYCPTTMSLSREKLQQIMDSFLQLPITLRHHVPGIHLEGPFLSSEKCGAQDKQNLCLPDVDFFRDLNRRCEQNIRIITMAPELAGGLDFIREISRETVVSLGHTDSDYATAAAAFEAGATHMTHLYNAMNGIHHREPGPIVAAGEAEHCYVELLSDGVHVHEAMVRQTFRDFPGRVVLISDSMRGTGLTEGEYLLGGQKVFVSKGKALLADGTIAGSVKNLFACMMQAVSFGVPFSEAVEAATTNPAKSIGIFHTVGSIKEGKYGNVLLVTKDRKLLRVITDVQ